MMRNLFATVAAFALAGALVAAQDPTPAAPAPQAPAAPPAASQPPTPEPPAQLENQILTGCLLQGSDPNVFILDNARVSTQPTTVPGKSYVVTMTDIGGLRAQLNHQVRITGKAEDKVLPAAKPGEKADEKDLPKLTASAVTSIATTCATAG